MKIRITAIEAAALLAVLPAILPATVPAVLSTVLLVAPVDAPLAASTGPGQADSRTVWRCTNKDGRTVFSDEPCPGAAQARPWKPKTAAAGIQRSAQPAGNPAPARAADAARHDPFVECQRRGGNFDPASRICRLPDDAARQMFGRQ